MHLEQALRIPYRIELYGPDADGDYLAQVPDLPGCASHAATWEEALANILDAKRVYLKLLLEEGVKLPPPRPGWSRTEYDDRAMVRAAMQEGKM